MENEKYVILSEATFNSIIQYLETKPFKEVGRPLFTILEEVNDNRSNLTIVANNPNTKNDKD
jgi:hypothetical protein